MKIQLAFLLGSSVFAFTTYAQPQASTMSPAVKHEVKEAEKMDKPLSDAQIVGILESANDGEIAAARKEGAHGKSESVKNFAKEMIDHHQANNDQVKALATKLHMTADKTAWTDKMWAHAMKMEQELDKKKGMDLDRTYIDGQVMAHQKVLDNMDTYLIPQAKNDELKTLLQNTRATVAQHLEEARNLQKTVNGGAQSEE